MGGDGVDEIIRAKAKEHGIPESLLRAIVQVESSGHPDRIRYEQHYSHLWKPEYYATSQNTLDTEKAAQKISWGLMQVMGATARWVGYRGVSLGGLLQPEVSLEYGCRYLVYQHERYKRLFCSPCWKCATAAYNAGSVRYNEDGSYRNQRYVDRVDRELGGSWPGECC